MSNQPHQTLVEEYTSTAEGMALFQREMAALKATELICGLMQEQGVSRADLAARLGKNKAYITRILRGTSELTLKTLSDVLVVLGRSLRVSDGPLSIGNPD